LAHASKACTSPALHVQLVAARTHALGLLLVVTLGYMAGNDSVLRGSIALAFAGALALYWCLPAVPADGHVNAAALKPLHGALARASESLASGLLIQKDAAKEDEVLEQRRLGPGKVFSPEGMRLNAFAGIPGLDFADHVYDKLTTSEQTAYDEFSSKFDKAMATRMHELDVNRFFQLPDQFTKLRFLQADNYRVDTAVERLIGTVIWRQTSGLDDFISNPDEALLRRYRALRVRRIVGYDKHNRPFMVERLGEFFGSDVVKDAMTLDQFITCYRYDLCEVVSAMREGMEKLGPLPYRHRVAYLGDLTGLRFIQTFRLLPLLKTLTKQVDTHFVELAGPLYLIRAPSIAMKIWSLVKVFLDPKTASNINIDSSDGKAAIGELFGWECVPREFGGEHDYDVPHVPKAIDDEFNPS